MEINGEKTDFERMLDEEFTQRYDACRSLLRANGIGHDVETIRSVMTYLRDGDAPAEERPARRERAREVLVKYITEYGRTPEYSRLTQEELDELLLDACHASQSDPLSGRIDDLIRHGANVNVRDEWYGLSAFALLRWKAKGEVLRLFLERGADPNEPILSKGRPVKTVWLDVVGSLDPEDMRQMLEHGARVDDRTASGRTALMEYCFRNPTPEGIAFLLDRGADPVPADEQGNTVLHLLARQQKAAEPMKQVIARKADVNAINGEGSTPLHIAAASMFCDSFQTAECLLAHGANPDLKDGKGDTPLIIAVNKGKREVIEALLKHGANRDIRDALKKTAFDIALAKKMTEIAVIIDPGADQAKMNETCNNPARIRQLKAEIIRKFKDGHTIETGNREGSSMISWVPDSDPPCYTIFVDDLGGRRTRSIETDEDFLRYLYNTTENGLIKQTEQAVYENIMAAIDGSRKLALPKVAPKQIAPDRSDRFEKYKDIYKFVRAALVTEEDLQATLKALDSLYAHRFGYSDRQIAMQALIPGIFGIVRKHIRKTADIERLCAELPRIMAALPEDSDDSPVGRLHRYDLSALRARALVARNMDEFASSEPIVVGSSRF